MRRLKLFLFLVIFVVFKILAAQEPQCSGISDNLRFDCFPENGATLERCEARGCCWKHPNHEEQLFLPNRTKFIKSTSRVPLNLPYCFYPKNYGYKLVRKEKTSTGYLLSLAHQGKSGPYGKDIEKLQVDVNLQDPSKVHFKIFDPNHKRYEVPIPINQSQRSTGNDIARDYDVSFSAFPFGIKITRKSTGTVIFNSAVGGMIFEDQFLQLSSLLPSSTLYGLGEHANPLLLDTHWKMATLFSRDEGTPEGFRYNLYGVHPFYINLENDGNTNGVFLLNSNAMDIILQPTPAITYRTIGGILDFYVFLGPTPDDVVKQYTTLVGKPFKPPYWGLGFHLCRWGYGSVSGTKRVNDRMRQYGIPQDVQWNDIDYMSKHLDFSIDPEHFSNLGDFVRYLHSKGQKYIPIVDPGISNTQPRGSYPPYDEGIGKGVFVLDANGNPLIGKVWPGTTVFPDFLNPKTASYWQKQIQSFYNKVPIDGLWIDMNEPSNFVQGSTSGCPNSNIENPPYVPNIAGGVLRAKTLCMSAKHYGHIHYDVHSLYGYSEAVVTNKALQNIRGNRTVVISRSTFPNSGSHGGHWLGDNSANWNDIKLSIPGILNMNLFGIPLVGADICGFNGPTNKELCARWTQLGAFYPFSRNHNSINLPDQDPAAFGPDFAKMARYVLIQRYRLLPYLYTLFLRAHMDGSAVARPLFYEFPKDRNTYAIDQQFMWGEAILITPVLTEGATSVSGYFPEGVWYDGYEGSPFEGGKRYTLDAPWDKINFHMRGGYIVPVQQEALTTSVSRTNPFELIVGLSTSGEARGELFWDDGESLENGPYTHIKYTASGGTLSSTVEGGYSIDPPLVYIAVFGLNKKPSAVTVNGAKWMSFSFNPTTKALSISNLKLSMMKVFSVNWM